jgi:hypothetical protein
MLLFCWFLLYYVHWILHCYENSQSDLVKFWLNGLLVSQPVNNCLCAFLYKFSMFQMYICWLFMLLKDVVSTQQQPFHQMCVFLIVQWIYTSKIDCHGKNISSYSHESPLLSKILFALLNYFVQHKCRQCNQAICIFPLMHGAICFRLITAISRHCALTPLLQLHGLT